MARPTRLRAARPVREPRWKLGLLGDWRLQDGEGRVALLHRERLLVAFLALHGSRPRGYVAGILWPDASDAHARASLRQALHAVRAQAPGLVEAGADSLSLASGVCSDVDVLREWCDRVERGAEHLSPQAAVEALRILPGPELLLGEFEEWVLTERGRIQRARLRALEALAVRLASYELHQHAIAACERAAEIEPLQEGPAHTLVSIYVALGNRVDAMRAYHAFRRRLWDELQAEPSPKMTALLACGHPAAYDVLAELREAGDAERLPTVGSGAVLERRGGFS
ncbi:AfsR/SARP family transcriptional regulator [Intrasporangium oryzae]|nr:BTAD domain-containing putative transcriptional regulator [Intrasporangium oryzae]